MDYTKTLDYLFTQLPMYQRIGEAAYKVDLSNTHLLCKVLNHPERKFKSVHVAGTNGKGSTSHLMAAALQEAGFKVGLYTSPHLKDFRERIKLNGEMISEEEVIAFVRRYKVQFEVLQLSFFEWTVGLAFDCFAAQEVDIAIIETGLGGRLDSTNVVQPEVAVITNIGIDHTRFLGTTLEQIAGEKAGIIKRNTPVVIGETQTETAPIFKRTAKKLEASILFADAEIEQDFATDLKGYYQQKNVKTAYAALQVLKKKGWKIGDETIQKGFLSVVETTGLLGRWQELGDKPLIICDTGHNKEGMTEIVAQLKTMTYSKLHVVFGAVNDKSIVEVLALLPKTAHYYFCQANIPRALAVNELYEVAQQMGLNGEQHESVAQALVAAKEKARAEDLIFIGGSTFVVAEVV